LPRGIQRNHLVIVVFGATRGHINDGNDGLAGVAVWCFGTHEEPGKEGKKVTAAVITTAAVSGTQSA
jgi:hypothetical protein